MTALVEAARSYIGTPFHHQARAKGVGIDCVGLVVCAARDAGMDVRDTSVYAREPDGRSLVEALSDQMDRVDGEAREGDVMAFWVRRPDLPQHLGIRSEHGIIHAMMRRRVAEHRLTGAMLSKLHSVWRLR